MFGNKTVFALLVVLSCATLVRAQALSAQQQRFLSEAKTAMDQAEPLIKNLETEVKTLKIGDAGTTVDKTQALLADRDKSSTLINTANARFRQLQQVLAQADVKAQYDRFKPLSDSLSASSRTLVDIHNQLARSGAQPTGNPPPTRGGAPAPSAQLGYQQQQLLRDTKGYLDQVEGTLQNLEDRTKNVVVGDASVQIQDVDSWVANKDRVTTYMGYVETRIKQLPAEHASVKPEIERYEKAKVSLASMDKKLTDVRAGLMKVVQQGGGEGYKADFDRLKEINQMFGDPQIIERRPETAIEIIKQIGPVKEERQRIATKYADLLKQSTPQAKDMNGVLAHFDDVFGRFETSLKNFVANAPAQIAGNIDEAIKLGQDATTNKRPAYFGEQGGVTQRLSWAQTRLNVLEAAAPGATPTSEAKQKLAAARQQVAKMQESLLEAIVQENKQPAETYNGPDKAQLVELVKTKWASSGNTAQVLKVGINSQGWQRDTRWEANRSLSNTLTFSKYDKSRIQGFVIVKHNNTMAAVYYINLLKDHMGEDRIEAHFFNDPKTEPDVINKMLLTNVK